MDELKHHEGAIAFMGVDPGTNNLGVAKIEFDPVTLTIVQTSAITCNAERTITYDSHVKDDPVLRRWVRLQWHSNNLVQLFELHQPIRIAVETNYYSRLTASAYGPLVESVYATRLAASLYQPNMVIDLIDPTSAKQAVGTIMRPRGKLRGKEEIKRKEENKLAVWRAIGERLDVLKLDKAMYDQLTEHASDAIAITYCAFIRYRETLHRTRNFLL